MKDLSPSFTLPKQTLFPNPLLRLPRNGPCLCGSGKKFKRCHLSQLPRSVPRELYLKNKKYMDYLRASHEAGATAE